MQTTILEILTYFIIYSILGWIMESIVRSIAERKIINTGFLIGPLCPIYGIGAIIMFLFLEKFENNIIILFLSAIIVLTLWEYAVGVLLEKLFHTKYWDYSNNKFNFQGRICLLNSICWGVLGVLFVKYMHPFIQGVVAKLNPQIVAYSTIIITIVVLVDAIISIVKVKNIKTTLEKIEDLNKEIKEKLKEMKIIAHEGKGENIQQIVDNLKKKRNRTILHLYRNVHRLKKAFPAIDTKEITQALNQKIDFKKKKKNT